MFKVDVESKIEVVKILLIVLGFAFLDFFWMKEMFFIVY